ncbi:MAG: hypothetical protein V3V19_03380 [Cocleimonas sp.]
MNQVKKLSGLALATAAATMLLAGTTVNAAKHEKAAAAEIKCSGINSCKGTSACATATSACAGQNGCKGQGWIKSSAKECADKGGTEVVAKK